MNLIYPAGHLVYADVSLWAGSWTHLRKAQMLRLILDDSRLLTFLEEGQRAGCCYRALQPCEQMVLAAGQMCLL